MMARLNFVAQVNRCLRKNGRYCKNLVWVQFWGEGKGMNMKSSKSLSGPAGSSYTKLLAADYAYEECDTDKMLLSHSHVTAVLVNVTMTFSLR